MTGRNNQGSERLYRDSSRLVLRDWASEMRRRPIHKQTGLRNEGSGQATRYRCPHPETKIGGGRGAVGCDRSCGWQGFGRRSIQAELSGPDTSLKPTSASLMLLIAMHAWHGAAFGVRWGVRWEVGWGGSDVMWRGEGKGRWMGAGVCITRLQLHV